MPLTEEHEKEPRGIFTKGYTNDDSTSCLVDGFIWAGHFPEFAGEVKSGLRKLSMDAEAKLAVCGSCGKVFSRTIEYCEHIRHRSPGAVRWLYDLTAVAGGAVKNPAGTGTVFPGKEGFVAISHDIEAQGEWWRKHWSKESEIPESSFADKKNRKYPFKGPNGEVDKEGWMAAWKYSHAHSATAVINVLKRHLPKGYKLNGDSVVKTTGGKMKVVCTECGHEHEVATDAEKIQAELDAKIKELEQLQADASTSQDKVKELEASNAESEVQVEAAKRTVDRFVELATEAGVDFAKEALPSLWEASDAVFGTFKAMASRLKGDDGEEVPPPKTPETVVAAAGEHQDSPGDTWDFEE